jgi:hypothetical protein
MMQPLQFSKTAGGLSEAVLGRIGAKGNGKMHCGPKAALFHARRRVK